MKDVVYKEPLRNACREREISALDVTLANPTRIEMNKGERIAESAAKHCGNWSITKGAILSDKFDVEAGVPQLTGTTWKASDPIFNMNPWSKSSTATTTRRKRPAHKSIQDNSSATGS